MLASKTKRTAKRVSSDIVPDRREEISTESAQNMTIGQMENENSTLPTGHYEAQHISLHSNDYAMQSQMMPAPPHFQPQIHYVTQTMQPMQPIQQQQRLLIHPNQQYRYHQAPLQYHHRNPYPPQQQSPPLVYGGYQEEYNPNYHIHEGYLDGRSYNNPHQLYFNEPIQNEYRQPFLPELPIKKAPISRRKPVSLGPRTLNYVKTVKVPIRKPYPDVYIPLSQTIPYERVVPRKVGQPSRSLKMLGNHAKDSISKNPRGSFRQLYATINPSL